MWHVGKSHFWRVGVGSAGVRAREDDDDEDNTRLRSELQI
jgi:hypothetical protein